jgi:hypothetical protein
LQKLNGIIGKGLAATADLWPDARAGFDLVRRAAHELGNDRGPTGRGPTGRGPAGRGVRRRYAGVLDDTRGAAERAAPGGDLRAGLGHVLTVTGSYDPGLFHCYDVPDLPRANNDLEHLFGSTRHHERRCTGRKAASPGLVLRGPVRVVAGLGTRGGTFTAADLAPADPQAWRDVRAGLERRRQARVLRHRFRRDPAKYLHQLEEILLRPALPP